MLAATRFADFIARYLSALKFARLLRAPSVLVRDAVNRVKAIEALTRRLLLAHALTLTVAKAFVRSARPRTGAAKSVSPQEAPLDDDPAAWRVRFCFGGNARAANRARPVPPPSEPRHPIFVAPARERAPRPPGAPRAYDAEAARCWRAARKAAREKAWRDFWLGPYTPPGSAGPGYIELPLSNVMEPFTSTLPLARRMEALRRVIADPAAYAQRLARRLSPDDPPRLVARWRKRRRRAPGCDAAMALPVFDTIAIANDTS